MNSPYIKIWKDLNVDYPIVEPAKVRRDFLDKTHNHVGYYCSPLTLANQHGWWFLLPQDVTVIWDGLRDGLDGEDPGHVQIISGQYYNGLKIASNDTGAGQISFLLNCNIETDPDHYLIFSGPPNYFFDEASPLEVIWRSDFYNYHSVSFNWRINIPNKEVVFPKGMPILFIKNYPINLINETSFIIDRIENSMDLKSKTMEYINQRNEWFLNNKPQTYPQFYKRGVGPGNEKLIENPVGVRHKKIIKNQ